ncbi:MAG: Fe-S cluster assembly sulfur transfer protein SufU [Acidobacteriota bacterium]
MSYQNELYQEVILDHNKNPRNFRALVAPAQTAQGHNPLCGDKVTVYVKMNGDIVEDISFEGAGCAISTASASLMTESLKGRSRREIQNLFKQFHGLVTGQQESGANGAELGKLAVFHGVSEYPIRVKCATLVWHTLQAALENKQAPVSTE